MAVSPITIPLRSLRLSPGSHLLVSAVTWGQYDALLEELGADRQIPRINYCNGTLELMSPLPAHERPHRIIAYIVTAILDVQGRAWEDFGSSTFKKPQQAGLEPDTCFYIQNAARVRGNLRIDLTTDPPPDLAIESDATSKTTLDAYAAIGVPEVWIYEDDSLRIHLLQAEGYVESATSLVFPDLNLLELIPQRVQQAFQVGTSQMLRDLRQQLPPQSLNPDP
ncbi:MAG: Uma2 family endonuclease [Cyanobacteria bacterium J069]|nr:MAG: Uma2 family endonuclease [Cyanobacteria bacterium J069]